ncbi:MAG: hypothetical protein GY847_01760 [Proteobacteria bacterium]|nr:hypothetical protein [Pseudomonadota bacterium]
MDFDQWEKPYEFRGYSIPARMMGPLRRYIEERIKPGDFLQAILSNDLKESCGRADEENLANLPAYCAFLYNEAPAFCYGSREKMEAWVEGREQEPKMGRGSLDLASRFRHM